MDYYKKFKEQLGFVVWISDSGLFGKLENWFTHEIVFFHMSAFQHFTMMGGELFHYRDKNAGETYLTKGDVLVYEKGKGTEGKGPATLWFGSAEECTRLMREDHIAKHDRCSCAHLFAGHAIDGSCGEPGCVCGHEDDWEEPDDLYAHGANAHPDQAQQEAEDATRCTICTQPEVICTCDTKETS